MPVNISAITEAEATHAQQRGGGGGDAGNADGGGADRQAQLQQQREKGQQVIFHVTAYNSQVEKILDVRLVQPGKKDNEQACKLIFRLRKLTSCLCSAATTAVCFEGRVAGLDATETGNELSGSKLQFTSLTMTHNHTPAQGRGIMGLMQPKGGPSSAAQKSQRRRYQTGMFYQT